MIELTVKTLDSQNHSFSVPDETTVKQLKEKIAESISFPVDSQRLIYCGRVLQDEKSLTEYDVNGKVIHLVQRPPPQVSRQNGNQSSSRTNTGQHRRANHAFRQPRVDANAMYLGAMAFPADLMDAQGIQAPPSSNVLSTSRLSLARTMLNRASNVLNRLENPQTSQEEIPGTPPGEEENMSATSNATGSITLSDSVTVGGSGQTLPSSLAHATQAATAAAIAAAVSAAHAVGVPNITIVRGGAGSSQQDTSIHVSGNSGSERLSGSQDIPGQEQSDSADSTGGNGQPASGTSNADDTPGRSAEAIRTTAMGELLATMTRVQQRLSPFALQYQRLMDEDPSFDENVTLAQDSQRIFNGVSEVFHYLSHAYHAMSDIMCDFGQTPPRSLRCRPVLIQHSAVLQAQINVMTNRGSENRTRQTASSQTNISTTSSTNNTAGGVSASTPAAVNTTEQAESPSADTPTTATGTTSSAQDPTFQTQVPVTTAAQQQRQTDGGSIPQPTFHITPGNVEFFMEVGPSSITIDSLEATVVTNSNGGNGGSGGNDGNGSGSFPWGGPAPPEFIQNLVQALGGHMMGRAGGSQSNGSSGTGGVSAGSVPASAAGNGGQNSQARGNTATHPTTATQTRSTSRPHVHLAPAAVQGLGSNYFDPFLPCNSHHIRSRRRGTSQATTPQAPQQQQQQQSQQQQQQQTSVSESTTQFTTPSTADLASQASSRASADVAATTTCPTSSNSGAASSDQANATQPQERQPQIPLFPPSLTEFLQNIATRNPQMPGSPYINIPAVTQLVQGFPAYSRDAFMRALFGGGSLAEILSTFPDYAYFEGESVFLDFLMTMARNMSFSDVARLSMGNSSILTRIRPQLQDFIRQKVLRGEDATEENISIAVHTLLQELRPHLKLLAQARVKDEVDIILSVNQYNQIRLPELIQMIVAEGRDDGFGRRFVQWCSRYAREVAAIVRYCCVDDLQGLENVVTLFVRHLMNGVQPDIRELTISSSLSHLQNFVARQTVTIEDIRPFLVYRIPSPPSSLENSAASLMATGVSTTEVQNEEEQVTEPMETDSDTPTVNGSLTLENHSGSESELDSAHSPANLVMDAETLPDVVLGSEPWHNVLPSDWVPIITRDTQRQRKQNSQAPFSDAYLAGMPSKRRKIVSNAKPQGSGNQILADGVRHAVTSSGMREMPNMETPGEDLELQAAYREQMKVSFQDNVATSSDVTSERFPNTTKYFEK